MDQTDIAYKPERILRFFVFVVFGIRELRRSPPQLAALFRPSDHDPRCSSVDLHLYS